MTIHSILEQRVIKTMTEFTKKSPMGSITTGMLSLIVKPSCGSEEFTELLDHMEHKGLLIGIPKGKTKRWRLD